MWHFRYALVLLVGFATGIGLMAMVMSPLLSIVRVEVVNESPQPLTNIVIQHEEGMVAIASLQPGSRQILPVLVDGESSYHIQATLPNGEILQGQEGYVEPGYRVRETISSNGIEHEHIAFY